MFLLPLCESRSETQPTKRPGEKQKKTSTAEEQKQNRSNSRHNETRIQQEKKPKTSSHKPELPQAAICFHGCCNRFCAVVADLVVLLHSTRQRWRREQQTTGGKYTAETEPEKYCKVQSLHSADFARFHPRGEQSEVRSWNTTAVRINPLGVDVEFIPAQLQLRHGMVYAAADAGPE